MGHGHAHHFAAVLKGEDVLDLLVGAHHIEPLAPEVHQLLHVVVGQLRHGHRMAGGIQNYFAFAIGRLYFEEIVCNPLVRLRRVLGKRREVVVILQHLIVRHIAEAGAKRAVVLGHLGASLPVGRNHHPVLNQWMPSQFRHDKFPPISLYKIWYKMMYYRTRVPPTGRMRRLWQLPSPVTASIALTNSGR